MLSLRESVSDPVQRAITRSALRRGVIAAVFVPVTLVTLLVALGAPGGIAVAIYAVAITAVLVVLCRSNWRTPSSGAPLAAHGPVI